MTDGLKVGALYATLALDDRGYNTSMDRAEKSLSLFGRTISVDTTRGLTVMGGAMATAGAASFAFSTRFNASMANVATLIPGNTARVKDLSKEVQSLAMETGKATTDISGGLYQTISAFGDTADTAKVLEINVKAAAAGVASTTDAINLTSAVTKGYGDTSAAAVQQAADLAFQTVKLGQTTFPELAASIGRVVPLSASLGVKQEELFAIMATGSGVTGNATEVSTQLRGVLQSLMAPTESMTELITSLGYANGEAMVKQLGVKGSIDAIVDAAKKSGKPLQEYMGSIEGQTLALALAGSQSDTFKQKLEAMGQASGAATEAYKEQTEGVNKLGHMYERAKQAGTVFMEKVGNVAPIVTATGTTIALVAQIKSLQIAHSGAVVTTNAHTASLMGYTAAARAAIPVVTLLAAKAAIIGGSAYVVYQTGKKAWEAVTAGVDAYRMGQQDRRGDEIALRHVAEGQGDIKAKLQRQMQARNAYFAANPTSEHAAATEAASQLSKEQEDILKASRERAYQHRLNLAMREADEIGRIKLEEAEALKAAATQEERDAIALDFADQVKRKKAEFAKEAADEAKRTTEREKAEQEKISREKLRMWEAETAAYINGMQQRLEADGRKNDAEYFGLTANYNRKMQLLSLETNASLRQAQEMEAYQTMRAGIVQLNDRIAEDGRRRADEERRNLEQRKADTERLLDSMIAEQDRKEDIRLNLLQEASLKVIAITQGETAAKLRALDYEHQQRQAYLRENLEDETDQAMAIQALDMDTKQKRDELLRQMQAEQGIQGPMFQPMANLFGNTRAARLVMQGPSAALGMNMRGPQAAMAGGGAMASPEAIALLKSLDQRMAYQNSEYMPELRKVGRYR